MDIPDYLSNIPNKTDWVSNADFRYGGFRGLHKAANRTLWGIFPNFREGVSGLHFNPKDVLDLNENNYDASELAGELTGVIGLGAFIIILGFFFTLMGIVWCICKCCCSSSGTSGKVVEAGPEYVENRFGGQGQQLISPRRKKSRHTPCKIGLGVFLICSMIVCFTFLIGLFIANSQFRDSVGNLTDDTDGYFEDANRFINLTNSQINAIMEVSYGDLSEKVKDLAGGCPKVSVVTLKSFENAKTALSELEKNLTLMMEEQQDLKSDKKVEPILMAISAKAAAIRDILKFCKLIDDVKQELKENADKITHSLDKVPVGNTRDDIKDFEEYFNDAKNGIFGGVTVVNLIVLVILAFITFGVIFLFWAPTKTTGSIFLNIAIFLIFLTGLVLCLLTLALFALSGTLVTLIPGAYDNIAENGSLINPISILSINSINGKLKSNYELPEVPHILQSCRNHDSAYNVFKLEQVFDVSRLDEIVKEFENAIPSNADPASVYEAALLPDLNSSRTLGKDLEQLLLSLHHLESELKLSLPEIESKQASIKAIDKDKILRQVIAYVDFAKEQITNETGSCEPLNNVIESVLHTFSYKLGSPLGAYWLSLNINIFMFLPVTIAAILILKQD